MHGPDIAGGRVRWIGGSGVRWNTARPRHKVLQSETVDTARFPAAYGIMVGTRNPVQGSTDS
eukprot:4353441-Pyramimonas_sp.AAC.1